MAEEVAVIVVVVKKLEIRSSNRNRLGKVAARFLMLAGLFSFIYLFKFFFSQRLLFHKGGVRDGEGCKCWM